MSDKNSNFPYKKYAVIFTIINIMYLMLFLQLGPHLDFDVLASHFSKDPTEFIQEGLLLFAVIIAIFCLFIAKNKAALVFALIPSGVLFLLALLLFFIVLLKSASS